MLAWFYLNMDKLFKSGGLSNLFVGRWNWLWRIVVAFGVVAIAGLARLELNELLGSGFVFITFFPAVALVAIVAGGWTGFLATVLSALTATWVVLTPGHSMRVQNLGDMVALGLFMLAGGLISVTAGMLGRARKQVWQAIEREKAAEKVRQAEEALRRSEEQMRRAQEIAQLGSWELDLERNRLLWSDEVYRIFGVEPQSFEATYEAFFKAVHPDDRAAVDAAYSASLQEGKPAYEIEHRIIRPSDGEVRIVHEKCEHFRGGSGKIVRSVGMVHDVTERRRVEEALRQSETRLVQAVGVGRLGIFEHDHRSGKVIYSPLMREISGFGPDEVITVEAMLKRVVPEDREAVAAAIRRAHDPMGDGMYDLEHRVIRRDGSIHWVSKRAQTFFEGEGRERRPVRTIGAALDVTERRDVQSGLERLVAERTAKLQELVSELEHFSYTITHDMRAPLRAMQGYAEILSESCCECQQTPREFLRRISVAAARMDCLITDALNYSRTVRQELMLAPVDAGALLRGMVDSYPELQPSKARIEIVGEIPVVMGNQAGLTQCFSNLLGNAVKFVKRGDIPQIRVWAERRGGTVRIWFEDNGVGIPKEMLPRVFDMFSRGHQGYEGTGIGLALVRKVMDRMDGKAGVESEEGKGSRFWIELKLG